MGRSCIFWFDRQLDHLGWRPFRVDTGRLRFPSLLRPDADSVRSGARPARAMPQPVREITRFAPYVPSQTLPGDFSQIRCIGPFEDVSNSLEPAGAY